MLLIYLDTLKQISGYTDRRSVQAWLAKELHLPLLRIGKNYGVDKAAFESRMEKKYRLAKGQRKYKPTQEAEKEFLDEVDRLLSKDNRVSSDIT